MKFFSRLTQKVTISNGRRFTSNRPSPLAAHSQVVQPPYREVNDAPDAPLDEAEPRRLRVGQDAESPRHVGVLTIQRSLGGEHQARVIAGKKLHRHCRQVRLARRKDSRREGVCGNSRHHLGLEVATAVGRDCKLKRMRPLLLRARRGSRWPERRNCWLRRRSNRDATSEESCA